MKRKTRVLIAKPGLDGHEKGAKMVAAALKSAGMEVSYTGPLRTTEEIVARAIKEDVDIVGLNIMSGGHLSETEKVINLLRARNARQKVVVGGFIPEEDIDKMKALGAIAVFRTGSHLKDIIEFMSGIPVDAK